MNVMSGIIKDIIDLLQTYQLGGVGLRVVFSGTTHEHQDEEAEAIDDMNELERQLGDDRLETAINNANNLDVERFDNLPGAPLRANRYMSYYLGSGDICR